MKKLLLCVAALCLLLAGCNKAPASEPTFGTFLPPTTTGHGHEHEQPKPSNTRPPVTTTAPTEPSLGPAEFTLYIPNETADGFITSKANINDLHHEGVLLLLMVKGAVNRDVVANSCRKDGTQLYLDLNQAFLDQLLTTGSSGEKMLIGSIVNTFLSAYDCETVLLTVNGESFDSGHTTYDFPLSFFE